MISRKEVLEKYGSKCAYCGADISLDKNDFHVDHIIPKARWHQRRHINPNIDCCIDDINNLNPACRSCNLNKNSWTLEEWRNELSKQAERSMKSINVRLAIRFNQMVLTPSPILFYFETVGVENEEKKKDK